MTTLLIIHTCYNFHRFEINSDTKIQYFIDAISIHKWDKVLRIELYEIASKDRQDNPLPGNLIRRIL